MAFNTFSTLNIIMKKHEIPNLNLIQTYDKFYQSTYIQYESLGNLATFFGRVMHLHRHDQYYQLHFIHHGTVHLQLGDQEYIETAPLLFFTPPLIPHSFITEPNATGQVLTIHQSLVDQLFKSINHTELRLKTIAACITLFDLPEHLQPFRKMLELAFDGLHSENQTNANFGQNPSLINWSQLIFTNLFRLMDNIKSANPSTHNQSALFRQYLSLIENHYHQHYPLSHYAAELNTTEGHLNKVCRRIANASSKQLIHERIILEAKYLLAHTNQSIQQIAFQLGFQDPAYFTRFFTKNIQITPKNYRSSVSKSAYDES